MSTIIKNQNNVKISIYGDTSSFLTKVGEDLKTSLSNVTKNKLEVTIYEGKYINFSVNYTDTKRSVPGITTSLVISIEEAFKKHGIVSTNIFFKDGMFLYAGFVSRDKFISGD